MMTRESAATGIQLHDEVTPLSFDHLLPTGVVLGGGGGEEEDLPVIGEEDLRKGRSKHMYEIYCGEDPSRGCSV